MSRMRREAAVSRDLILGAAVSRFLRNGYTRTSLSSIAADVGVTTPALYWHFASKEEIFSAAVEHMLISFVTFVRESVSATDPAGRLAQTVAAHVTWQLEQADVASAYAARVGMRALLADTPREHQAMLVGVQREYMEALKSTLADGHRLGVFVCPDEGVVAYAIVTMCEYAHAWFRPDGRLTVAEIAQQIVGLALRSVRAVGGTSAEPAGPVEELKILSGD